MLAAVKNIGEGRRDSGMHAQASISDAKLVQAARLGDRWARDALYRRHARPLGGMSARLLGSRQDVDDVVHDAFLKAFQQLDTLRDPAHFRAWLFGIAISEVRMLLRKRRLKAALGFHSIEDATLELLVSKEVDAETRSELARIDGALRTLPADERIAWMLRHVEGHSLEETAVHCGCSLATAKRRIRAAALRVEAHTTEARR